MSSDFVIAVVVVAALAFGFTNGFHDTLDLVATAVSGGSGSPQVALAVAAVLNFVGAFLSVQVAQTIATDVIDPTAINPAVVFAGLLSAIVWNLATWSFRLPSSSSHALIGGVVGATLAAVGTSGVIGGGLVDKVLLPALVAPLLAFAVALVAIVFIYHLFGRRRPGTVIRGFRVAQFGSGGLLALAHGANDIQKTTGVITLALIANGTLGVDAEPPLWATLSAAAAIAVGTYAGGLRMVRMSGSRIIKMDAAQGFSAQSSGAVVILVATFLGFPISTTHAINGGVMGAGATKRLSAARWGIAGNIVTAWLLTLPAAAALGAAVYGLMRIAGTGVAGPLLVAVASVLLLASLIFRRVRGSVATAAS